MLTRDQADRLAAWVNTHDDGTPQPRASVKLRVTPWTHESVWQVRILSTEYLGGETGTPVQCEDFAESMGDARAILGY